MVGCGQGPLHVPGSGNLGLALYESGQLGFARERLERAPELNPGYSKIWNNLGLVYEGLNLKAQAAASLTLALSCVPICRELSTTWEGSLSIAASPSRHSVTCAEPRK